MGSNTDERSLEEKQASLHKKGMSMVQRKMMKAMMYRMTPMSMLMGVMPHELLMDLRLDPDNEETPMRIIMRNRVNKEHHDMTHRHDELMEHSEETIFDKDDIMEFLGGAVEIKKEMSEYWNTPIDNLRFLAWINYDKEDPTNGRKHRLVGIIKPIRGFEKWEYIKVTPDAKKEES